MSFGVEPPPLESRLVDERTDGIALSVGLRGGVLSGGDACSCQNDGIPGDEVLESVELKMPMPLAHCVSGELSNKADPAFVFGQCGLTG